MTQPAAVARLAVAALSARTLVEAAVRAGYRAVALDLFGDTDTRAAATQWLGIGNTLSSRIEPELFLRGLHGLARSGQAEGWVYGSGFEGLADVLQDAEGLLPLWGTSARALRRLRRPEEFFGCLEAHHLPHPEVLFSHANRGWLLKAAGACGAAHIRRADATQKLPDGFYAQREVPGRALSASYLANGREALVLGFNEQLVQAHAGQPFVFSGVIGPIPLPDAVRHEIERALSVLTTEFDLRGLGSLDFMLDRQQLWLLEVNPRPSASLPLHDHRSQPLLHAHAQACQGEDLATLRLAPSSALVRGIQTLFARQRVHINHPHAAVLQARTQVHDCPTLGSVVDSGQPLCSVSASALDADGVRAELAKRASTLLSTLESIA